jgi:hypothetical protein
MALAAARSIVAPYGCGDDGIRIVSARHGLLALDTIVEPYDTTIGDTDAVTPATIAAQADEQGVAGHPSPIMLLPRRYRDLVETSGAWDVDTMIDGYVGGLDTEGIGRMRGTCAHVVAAEPTRKRELARTSTQEEAR